MDSPDWEVLTTAQEWLKDGFKVYLFTVVKTWGSAPRVPGSILALRSDGHLAGSVSGGCIEDDLADKVRNNMLVDGVSSLIYGISRDEAQLMGIPCGGKLQIIGEALTDASTLQPIIESIEQRHLLCRSINMRTGEIRLSSGLPGQSPSIEGEWFYSYFGPQWRLLIIGANQLGSALASIALTLDFDVLICDPREEMRDEWRIANTQWRNGMPDDVVLEIVPDSRTAIVAVTHDPKLDDMALLEALRCNAMYVGALGSRKSQQKRRERLRMFDLTEDEIERLRGPVGLAIGSRTPAEIAISILAEIIHVRSQQRIVAESDHEPIKSLALAS